MQKKWYKIVENTPRTLTKKLMISEFALSNKTILVEGPAEYMLFDNFYKKIHGHKMEGDNVQVMDVRGLSFKRFLEIAAITGAKVDGAGERRWI